MFSGSDVNTPAAVEVVSKACGPCGCRGSWSMTEGVVMEYVELGHFCMCIIVVEVYRAACYPVVIRHSRS